MKLPISNEFDGPFHGKNQQLLILQLNQRLTALQYGQKVQAQIYSRPNWSLKI
jgi:hypothetical protein